MNSPVRAVLCGVLLAACSSFALADTVSVTGNVNFTQTSLTFAPPFATQTNTGAFSSFSGGQVNYMLGTVAYMDGIPQTEVAFTITDASGNVLAFFDEANAPVQTINSAGNLAVALNETGYYTINGGNAMAGYFNVNFTGTSPDGSTTNVPFLGTGGLLEPTVSAMTGVAPEPTSILFLGTGLLGTAFLVRRRQLIA